MLSAERGLPTLKLVTSPSSEALCLEAFILSHYNTPLEYIHTIWMWLDTGKTLCPEGN